jgi:hypothetical protein
MICTGGAAVQGAVWNGERGLLPGPFRGSHGKDVEYEEIQPFLVAAWRHSVVGGDRLQPQLHERRRKRGTGYGRSAPLCRCSLQRSYRRCRRIAVFARLCAKLHGWVAVYVERCVAVHVSVGHGLSCAEYVFSYAAGTRQHPLKDRCISMRFPPAPSAGKDYPCWRCGLAGGMV